MAQNNLPPGHISKVNSWIRDPLILFLALGAALFAAAGWWDGDAPDRIIEVDAAEVNRLTEQWNAQMGRSPSAEELESLIDSFIQEEIYFREALRLSLDQGDIIVRRRLVQKLNFLTEDIAASQSPSEAALRAFHDANAERYRLPPRFSFRHRYFSTDRRANAKADAEAALEDPQVKGDPFMLQRAYAERSERAVGDLFGRPFAAALATLSPAPEWQGPLRSAYGWHLVKLEQRQPESQPPFEEVAGRVTADFTAERREEANAAYYEALRSRYEVRRP